MKKIAICFLLMCLNGFVFSQKIKEDVELQKLKADLAAAQHDTTRMMAYVDISFYFRDVAVLKDVPLLLDSALVYSLKAKAIAETYPNYPKGAKVWNNLGYIYADFYYKNFDPVVGKQYFEQAEKYFKKSIDVAMQLDYKNYRINPLYNLMQLYNHSSNKYRFFKISFELINHIQSKTQLNEFDSLALSHTCKNLCSALDYEMGSKKYNTYLSLSQRFACKECIEEYDQLCVVIFNQHALSWKKSDEQKILKEYKTYKQTIKTIYCNDQLDYYLAQYYFTIQEYEKSFRLIADIVPHNYGNILNYNKMRWAFLGMKYMIMGQNGYMLNRNQEAIRYLRKAVANFTSVENQIRLENEKYTTLLYLGKAYKKAGNYKQALACNEQADILYKQMHDIGAQALMAENDVQVEQIKQDKRVHEAQTQTLLKEQELRIEQRQKYILLAISIIALLSMVWALINFRKTRKQNQIISQQATSLQESNQVKDKIFALLGHDLRAPINRLVMRMQHSDSGELPNMRHELKNMHDILNNVLYWASMQLKKVTPVNRPIELTHLVSSVAEEYQFDLADKNITFLNTIDKTIEIKTDENYLKIILRNLISNAIKFSNPNGFIKVDCSVKNGVTEISLKDTGIGIPTEKLKTIFNLPTPSMGTRQEKGTGLGLSLSLDIAKKLNGHIQVKSQEGRGTQVVLSLAA